MIKARRTPVAWDPTLTRVEYLDDEGNPYYCFFELREVEGNCNGVPSRNGSAPDYRPGGTAADANAGNSSGLAVAIQQALDEAHHKFVRLHDLHANALVGFLCNQAQRFGVWLDEADKENLSQEVWMLSWQSLSKPNGFKPGPFRGWLFTIALNHLRQWVAKKQRQPGQLPCDPEGLPSSRNQSSPHEDLHNQELKGRLENFLGALKALEDLDADGKTSTLDSPGAVKAGRPGKDVELHRALQQLHKRVRRVTQCINRVLTR